MRLPADQVKTGLLHADQDVRAAAVLYFADSCSPDPTIMPLVIQAIATYGFQQAFPAYEFLDNIVQTDDTVRWLIQRIRALEQPTGDDEFKELVAYAAALLHADPDVLKVHETAIMTLEGLDDDSKDAIGERIWFSSRTGEELWSDLEEFCETHECDDALDGDEVDSACRIVEALGRHHEEFSDIVLAIVCGDTEEFSEWMEGFAMRLAGEMRLEEAIPWLVDTLNQMPDEWVDETCYQALIKMDSEALLDEFTAAVAPDDADASTDASLNEINRMTIAGLLKNIHTDRAVQLCLDMLLTEKDQETRAFLIQAILLSCATEGIEPARRYILDTPMDLDVLEVRATLLTTCKLLGETFPEFDAWLEDSRNDDAIRQKWFEDHPVFDDDGEFDGFDDEFDNESMEELFAGGEFFDFEEELEPPPLQPNERVGRNDPCPCGSGQKFRNCCYNKRRIVEETDPNHASAMSNVVQGNSKPTFPIGTVALYGPDDTTTTKIVAGVIAWEGADPMLERWMGTNIKDSLKVRQQIQEFFQKHGVRSVVATAANIGCPHEEGEDFPDGEDCPFCPFWKGKQGSNQQEP